CLHPVIMASVQQKKLENKWFIPNISLEGSMNLSGREFPLREPDFSLRIKMSFDRNTLFPANNTTSLGFDQQQLRSLGNAASGNLNPQLNYFSQKRLNSIALLQKQLSLEVSEERLRDSLRELLLNFDNSYENYLFSKESLGIQQKKVEINWQKLENGAVTEMDYLESLIELSTMEIQLVELQSNLVSLLRTIELSAGITPGGLDEIL
ncbi:MAG: TolC family protein, partial [Spirochaetaceae bacterium]|nr:TolC family protein [Spirochaetaceae bacterium]